MATGGRNTIKGILQEQGMDPPPALDRGKLMPLSNFIKAHRWGVLVGMDSFTVEVVTWFGVVRYHVLFAIDIAGRKIDIPQMSVDLGGAWMEQVGRNPVDSVDGFLLGKRYVLTGGDPPYTSSQLGWVQGIAVRRS